MSPTKCKFSCCILLFIFVFTPSIFCYFTFEAGEVYFRFFLRQSFSLTLFCCVIFMYRTTRIFVSSNVFSCCIVLLISVRPPSSIPSFPASRANRSLFIYNHNFLPKSVRKVNTNIKNQYKILEIQIRRSTLARAHVCTQV